MGNKRGTWIMKLRQNASSQKPFFFASFVVVFYFWWEAEKHAKKMAFVGNNWKQIEAAITQTHLILHLASSNFLEVLHPED